MLAEEANPAAAWRGAAVGGEPLVLSRVRIACTGGGGAEPLQRRRPRPTGRMTSSRGGVEAGLPRPIAAPSNAAGSRHVRCLSKVGGGLWGCYACDADPWAARLSKGAARGGDACAA